MSTLLDPRAIEEEIARIREKESNPYSSGTKTNIFTLLVFRSDDAAGPRGSRTTSRPPCSTCWASDQRASSPSQRAQTPQTEAWVSGRCFPDRRNRGVCFEEVHIECGDDGVGADPGAWSPLVIRDLPVFAWMPDALQKESAEWTPALRGSAGLIDKLLVDSSRSGDESGAAGRRCAGSARGRRTTSSFPISPGAGAKCFESRLPAPSTPRR